MIPHTPEWFAELAKRDAMQAAMTQQVIQMAGSPNVCGICGDADCVDYDRMDGLPA